MTRGLFWGMILKGGVYLSSILYSSVALILFIIILFLSTFLWRAVCLHFSHERDWSIPCIWSLDTSYLVRFHWIHYSVLFLTNGKHESRTLLIIYTGNIFQELLVFCYSLYIKKKKQTLLTSIRCLPIPIKTIIWKRSERKLFLNA